MTCAQRRPVKNACLGWFGSIAHTVGMFVESRQQLVMTIRAAAALLVRAAHLDGEGGDDALRVHQGRLAQVVQAVAAEDLRAGLEPHRLLEGRLAARLQQLRSSYASAVR